MNKEVIQRLIDTGNLHDILLLKHMLPKKDIDENYLLWEYGVYMSIDRHTDLLKDNAYRIDECMTKNNISKFVYNMKPNNLYFDSNHSIKRLFIEPMLSVRSIFIVGNKLTNFNVILNAFPNIEHVNFFNNTKVVELTNEINDSNVKSIFSRNTRFSHHKRIKSHFNCDTDFFERK